MDKPRGHVTKQNKPDPERQNHMISFICISKLNIYSYAYIGHKIEGDYMEHGAWSKRLERELLQTILNPASPFSLAVLFVITIICASNSLKLHLLQGK